MKLVITKTNLSRALSIVDRIKSDQINLPILKNFLFETIENKIKISSTNLEIGVSVSFVGKIIENGKITIPITIFSELVNNIQTERLNIEVKKNDVNITTDNYEATIHGQSADEFPFIPKIKNHKEYIKIKTEVLKESLQQVLIASQFSDLRPELNNILFSYSLDTLKITATDSFRLAEKTIPSSQYETTIKKTFKVLIPLRTSHELTRIFSAGEYVKIYHDEQQILFETEYIEFISRLTEGNFPDYASIVPQKFTSELTVDREEFINALKLAGIFGSKNQEVKMKSLEGKKIIEIFSTDQSIGENKYLLPAKTENSIPEISFNWRYLIDVLKILKANQLFIGISEESKPVLIKSPTDMSYFYILMPILKA